MLLLTAISIIGSLAIGAGWIAYSVWETNRVLETVEGAGDTSAIATSPDTFSEDQITTGPTNIVPSDGIPVVSDPDLDYNAYIRAQDSYLAVGKYDALSYIITDQDGLNYASVLRDLEPAVDNSGIFELAAYWVNTSGSTGVTEDGLPVSAQVYIEGQVSSNLNFGNYQGPEFRFNDAEGNTETVYFQLDLV